MGELADDDTTHEGGSSDDPRLEQVEERFALPVILAAIVSVPAVFMTMLDGTTALVGQVLNTMSLIVLTGETVVLFVLARDRRQWVREHKFIIGVTAVTVPAVIFAVGPVQLLRLVRFVGALRVIRVGRILKAGRILSERAGLTRWWQNAIAFGVSALVAAFVAIILADETSTSRELADAMLGRVGIDPGPGLAVLAGVFLAIATFVVLRYGSSRGSSEDGSESRAEATQPSGTPRDRQHADERPRPDV
ncbi:ion transporter [Egibacter rhizosphaerae]|uniref:ion transporter n=1 Tax=Egibacter rhizosphaerae TaxID=1670831 RepID=UPI00197A8E56|nr:ion transporter [Egibacter rhizosphaerae]